MNPVKEALDYSMKEGETKRIAECWKCVGMGSSNGVQLTRTDDGFMWYCFRCDHGGFFDNRGMSAGQARAALEAAMQDVKKVDTKPRMVTLPDDFTTKLPPKALVELWKYGIEDPAIHEKYNLGVSPSYQRLVIPVYQYGRYGEIHSARKLVAHMGRDLTGEHKSKWFMVRQQNIKHPVFVAYPYGYDWIDDRIVMVEDVFSAIKVSMAGYFCIALLTTYVPYELYNRLKKFAEVILWLDDDAFAQSMNHIKRMCSYGIPASNRWGGSGEDPKYHSVESIREMIENPVMYETNGGLTHPI